MWLFVGAAAAAVGDNKWQQTWTSISVITRRAEQRQWQTSARGPSIYETGHASNRKTPHTVMAGGKAHRQLITALNFDASPRAGEKIYIIPLFLHRWWDTGSVCVCVCVSGVLNLCEKKKVSCTHTYTQWHIFFLLTWEIHFPIYWIIIISPFFPPSRKVCSQGPRPIDWYEGLSICEQRCASL